MSGDHLRSTHEDVADARYPVLTTIRCQEPMNAQHTETIER